MRSADELSRTVREGRAAAAERLEDADDRGHTVLTIRVRRRDAASGAMWTSVLRVLDVAGPKRKARADVDKRPRTQGAPVAFNSRALTRQLWICLAATSCALTVSKGGRRTH